MKINKISTKTIFLDKNLVSYSSSLLHLPIFTSLHSGDDTNKFYNFVAESYWGFKDLSITAPWLSINTDFKVFTYILKKYYSGLINDSVKLKENSTIIFDIEEYLEDNEIKTNISKNVNLIYSSIEKLTKVTINFSKDSKRYVCRVLASGAIFETGKTKGSFELKIDEHFIDFFNHDPELILNISHNNLKKIKGDFAKILYIFYITNQSTGTFNKKTLIQRLRPEAEKEKWTKILYNIGLANKELIDCGFIESYEFVKEKNNKEVSSIKVKISDDHLLNKYKKTKKEELKTDLSGFDNDDFIENPGFSKSKASDEKEGQEPKDDEIPF